MYQRAGALCALFVAATFSITLLAGCGDDDSHSNGPPPPPGGNLGGTTDVILTMAENLGLDIASDEITSLLFPSSEVDVQELIDDFLEATQQLLTQQTVTEQAGLINGNMGNIYTDEGTWNAIANKSALENRAAEQQIYDDIKARQGDTNDSLGILEQELYASEGFSSWLLGAQVWLNAQQFLVTIDPYINGADITAADSTTLANSLQGFIGYAVDERSQIFYQNVVKTVNKVTDCEKGDPCQGEDDCSYSYTDCNGKSHLYKYDSWNDPSDACHNGRVQEIQMCADDEYSSTATPLEWISDTLDSWHQSLTDVGGSVAVAAQPCAICEDSLNYVIIDPVHVDPDTGDPDPIGSMTYSKQVTSTASTTVAEGQVRVGTSWIAAACNGRYSCDLGLVEDDFDLDKSFVQVDVTYRCGSDTNTDRQVSVAGVGNPRLSNGSYVHVSCAPGIVNAQASFRGQPVQLSNTGATETDLSTDIARPNASKINDDIAPTDGHSAADTTYVIILPHNQQYGALTIDLGSTVTVCGNGYQCFSEPKIQADNDDIYQLDYSLDGVNWTKYGQFPTKSDSSGLYTRTFDCNTRPNPSQPCSSTNHGPNFMARYVRVFATTGGNTFSVSELTLWNSGSQMIAFGKPSWGPEPLITNGQYAPEGTSWNNSEYATVLSGTGTTHALTVDLKGVHTGIDHIKVQASNNDTYQVDASIDGTTWTPFYVAGRLEATNLRTRDSGPVAPTTARYLRVYATDGDGEYSVSEVQAFSDRSLQQSACDGQSYCYFSPAELLNAQLNGAAPTAQDLQDFEVTWSCGNGQSALFTAHAVSWNSQPVVELRCPVSSVTCNMSEPTTCSPFAADRDNDVVYQNVATIPYQICPSTQYPECVGVIQGKTNYYKTNFSTMNKPACENVQQAIADAITEHSCPPAVGTSDPYASLNAWPYNTSIGTPPSSTCLPDPISQPALLADVGCGHVD